VFVVVLAILAAGIWWGVGLAQRKGMLGPVVVPEQYRSLLLDAAATCPAVPVQVLAAQIAAESGWGSPAQSAAGAQGIAQFMPGVWHQYGIDANGDGKANVWDPADAIATAAKLNCLNHHLVRKAAGNRLENTLAAYNAGYGAVLRYNGIPPYPETRAYVTKILHVAKTIKMS